MRLSKWLRGWYVVRVITDVTFESASTTGGISGRINDSDYRLVRTRPGPMIRAPRDHEAMRKVWR